MTSQLQTVSLVHINIVSFILNQGVGGSFSLLTGYDSIEELRKD